MTEQRPVHMALETRVYPPGCDPFTDDEASLYCIVVNQDHINGWTVTLPYSPRRVLTTTTRTWEWWAGLLEDDRATDAYFPTLQDALDAADAEVVKIIVNGRTWEQLQQWRATR